MTKKNLFVTTPGWDFIFLHGRLFSLFGGKILYEIARLTQKRGQSCMSWQTFKNTISISKIEQLQNDYAGGC